MPVHVSSFLHVMNAWRAYKNPIFTCITSQESKEIRTIAFKIIVVITCFDDSFASLA